MTMTYKDARRSRRAYYEDQYLAARASGEVLSYGRSWPPRELTPDEWTRYRAIRAARTQFISAEWKSGFDNHGVRMDKYITITWLLPGVGSVTQTYDRTSSSDVKTLHAMEELGYPIAGVRSSDEPINPAA